MMRRRMGWAVAVLALALGLAGCGGDAGDDGIATAGGGSGSSPSASASAVAGDADERMLQFTECMRGEGIEMEDPEPGGGFQFRARGGDQAKTQAAMEKCRQYMPNGGEQGRMNPADLEKAREYSKCMRDNGVPNFPDPDPETGGIMLRAGPDSGIDMNDPAFAQAQKTCENLRPQRAGGSS